MTRTSKISGGGGGASKIDAPISQKAQDEANAMLTENPDQVASILTTVLQNPNAALESEQISSCGERIQERSS